MFPLLYLLLIFLTGSLSVQVHASSSAPVFSQELLVHEYTEYLENLPISSFSNEYDQSMEDQIQCFQQDGERHYVMIPGQENEPMKHLIDAQVEGYCHWKSASSSADYSIDEEKSHDGLYFIAAGALGSPLMMFGQFGRRGLEENKEETQRVNSPSAAEEKRSETAEHVSHSTSPNSAQQRGEGMPHVSETSAPGNNATQDPHAIWCVPATQRIHFSSSPEDEEVVKLLEKELVARNGKPLSQIEFKNGEEFDVYDPILSDTVNNYITVKIEDDALHCIVPWNFSYDNPEHMAVIKNIQNTFAQKRGINPNQIRQHEVDYLNLKKPFHRAVARVRTNIGRYAILLGPGVAALAITYGIHRYVVEPAVGFVADRYFSSPTSPWKEFPRGSGNYHISLEDIEKYGKTIKKGTQEYCDFTLKMFSPEATQIRGGYNMKFNPEEVCQAITQESQEGLNNLVKHIGYWNGLTDYERQIGTRDILQDLGKKKAGLDLLLKSGCDFKCPPGTFEAAQKALEQQDLIGKLFRIRMQREGHAEQVDILLNQPDQIYSDASISLEERQLIAENTYGSLPDKLKEEKSIYRKLIAATDDSGQSLLSLETKQSLKDYYKDQQNRLTNLEAMLDSNGPKASSGEKNKKSKIEPLTRVKFEKTKKLWGDGKNTAESPKRDL